MIPQRNWHAQEQKLFSSILAHIPHSSLEKEEAQFSNCVLEQERNDILNQITLLKNDFDTALLSLRHEKLRTEADVKYGEISWLVMFNELELLNDFQKREIGLNSKLQDKVADKGTVSLPTTYLHISLHHVVECPCTHPGIAFPHLPMRMNQQR